MDSKTDIPAPPDFSNSPVPSVSPFSSSKSKLPLILLFITLLFVVGVFSFFLGRNFSSPSTPLIPLIVTPTPNSTVNWKTYTSKEFGYSVKLPIDLEVLSESIDKVEFGDRTFKTVISTISKVSEIKSPSLTEEFFIDRRKAEKFRLEQTTLLPIGRFYYIYVRTKEKPFIEIKNIVDIYNPNPEYIFDQILSTFKFL